VGARFADLKTLKLLGKDVFVWIITTKLEKFVVFFALPVIGGLDF